MRLFTGIEIPPDILEKADTLLARLKPLAAIQWSPVSNLHLTTKFIGEWPEEKLAGLTGALGGIHPTASIPIRIGGLGFFPNAKSPRVCWAGIHAPPALAELAAETDRALAPLGIPAETRAYSPHLTLARIKKPEPLTALREALATLGAVELGAFEASRFHLYRSKPGPKGSVYTRLATFEF